MSRSLKAFYFTIDLRSLGLYRVLLAALLILDWFLRWPDLEVFYTSFGALPVESPLPKPGGEFHFCLLDGVTSLAMVRAVFLAGLACYLLLLVGYRTRFFQCLSFLFFTSAVSRCTLVREGSVMVLATMLLWSIFLPMWRRFSLDSLVERLRSGGARSGSAPAASVTVESSAPSLAALAMVAQIGLIYFFTASAKYGVTWHDGTALYYALNEDQIARPFGRWLATQPLGLIKVLTWGALGVEFAALPLILAPVAQPWLRRLAVVSLAGLHLGIAATTTLGFFSTTMVATYALLLLPEDWALLGRIATGPGLRRCRGAAARLVALGEGWLSRCLQAGEIVPPVRPHRAPGPLWLRRCRFWGANLVVAVLLVAFTLDAYNFNLTKRLGRERIPEPRWMRALILVPLIQHDWELFAPDPIKDDGWWVIAGETEAGESVDPLTGTTPSFDKPTNLSACYDRFWRKYLERLWLKRNHDYRLYFGKYITRKNHRDAPEGHRLARFDFYYVKERTLPPGTPQPFPTERVLLWHHECFPRSKTLPPSESGSEGGDAPDSE